MLKEVLYYIEGLDESIIKLNEYLIDNHFEFVPFTPVDFLKKFKSLIPKNENEDNDYNDIIPALGMSIDDALGLDNSKYFNQSQIVNDKHLVFLRYSEFERSLSNKEGVDSTKLDDFKIQINERVKELIEKLKLIKSGHIKIISEFEFTNNSECIPISHSYPSKNINNENYFFDKDDIIDFGRLKQSLATPKSYLELALNSFFESYNIENERLKFVMLMVCLESIYNINGRKIKEKISKYSALTISNKKNFDENVEKIIFLYELRCDIVHGRNQDILENEEYKRNLENISQYILKLEEIIRNVLKELILNKEYSKIKDKKELFDYLNAKGLHS